MKSRVIIPLASLLIIGLLQAEDLGARTKIEESFLGSDSKSYALLRTETKSTHSGEKISTRTWLDEYTKKQVILYKNSANKTDEARIMHGNYASKLIRSVLLLDVTHGQPKTEDPDSEKEATAGAAIHKHETALALSELLLRYPHRNLKSWPTKHFAQLRYSDASFFVSYKSQTMVNGSIMRQRMGGVRMGDASAKILIGSRTIDQVAEDENSAYVTITATTAKRVQTRIFCMVPSLTKNLHALWSREPLYLTTGWIHTKEDALQTAKEVRRKLDGEKEWATTGIELWTLNSTSYSRAFFCVAIPGSMELIKKRRVRALSESLGIQLVPTGSSSFSVLIEKFP
ncbi:MAG: hypothetical protein KJO21_05425 [Verrucomicrobiae bacterium]|nr:hypothetical protein [Verrucomicrobiae bacterium]NNJ43162.1 hypothetical protein [Akkermansiaceae bacterium]